MIWKLVAIPRWLTGMPAYAGTEIAEVIPGTTSNSTPASTSSRASSPPRPNTNGSPPLRRATIPEGYSFANWTSSLLISDCLTLWWVGILPTSTIFAPALHIPRIAGETSRSYTTTSARSRISFPRSVKSPGSPGPAPIK